MVDETHTLPAARHAPTMDMTLLTISFLFGTVGFGIFLYGKKCAVSRAT